MQDYQALEVIIFIHSAPVSGFSIVTELPFPGTVV
jgi:hypothetical protein